MSFIFRVSPTDSGMGGICAYFGTIFSKKQEIYIIIGGIPACGVRRVAFSVWRSAFVTNLISQLLVTQFWPNFKGRFLGPSSTDSNYNGDICPSNICHGDICPHQKYLSWSNFDRTLNVGSWDHLTDANYHFSWKHLSIYIIIGAIPASSVFLIFWIWSVVTQMLMV